MALPVLITYEGWCHPPSKILAEWGWMEPQMHPRDSHMQLRMLWKRGPRPELHTRATWTVYKRTPMPGCMQATSVSPGFSIFLSTQMTACTAKVGAYVLEQCFPHLNLLDISQTLGF